MTSVKGSVPRTEWHAALLMGFLLRQVRDVFAAEDWKGLRQSHFRVISAVPAEGINITELGDRVGMTKQGCGQFVTQLVQSGQLRVVHSPSDRRTRIVHRTTAGNRTIEAVTARNLRLEQDWAEQVGSERYGIFREVLEELAMGR
jgi:DNA-binding MarR family transcriptional regulator